MADNASIFHTLDLHPGHVIGQTSSIALLPDPDRTLPDMLPGFRLGSTDWGAAPPPSYLYGGDGRLGSYGNAPGPEYLDLMQTESRQEVGVYGVLSLQSLRMQYATQEGVPLRPTGQDMPIIELHIPGIQPGLYPFTPADAGALPDANHVDVPRGGGGATGRRPPPDDEPASQRSRSEHGPAPSEVLTGQDTPSNGSAARSHLEWQRQQNQNVGNHGGFYNRIDLPADAKEQALRDQIELGWDGPEGDRLSAVSDASFNMFLGGIADLYNDDIVMGGQDNDPAERIPPVQDEVKMKDLSVSAIQVHNGIRPTEVFTHEVKQDIDGESARMIWEAQTRHEALRQEFINFQVGAVNKEGKLRGELAQKDSLVTRMAKERDEANQTLTRSKDERQRLEVALRTQEEATAKFQSDIDVLETNKIGLLKSNSDFLARERELKEEIERLTKPAPISLAVPVNNDEEHKLEVARLKTQLDVASGKLTSNQMSLTGTQHKLRQADEKLVTLTKQRDDAEVEYRLQRDRANALATKSNENYGALQKEMREHKDQNEDLRQRLRAETDTLKAEREAAKLQAGALVHEKQIVAKLLSDNEKMRIAKDITFEDAKALGEENKKLTARYTAVHNELTKQSKTLDKNVDTIARLRADVAMHNELLRQSNGQVAELETVHETRVKELEASVNAKTKALKAVHAKLGATEQSAAEEQTRLITLSHGLENELKETVDQLNTAKNDHDDAYDQIADLIQQLKEANERNASTEAARARLEATNTDYLTRGNNLMAERDTLLAEKTTLSEHNTYLQGYGEKAFEANTALKAEKETLLRAQEGLQADNDNLMRGRELLQAENERLFRGHQAVLQDKRALETAVEEQKTVMSSAMTVREPTVVMREVILQTAPQIQTMALDLARSIVQANNNDDYAMINAKTQLVKWHGVSEQMKAFFDTNLAALQPFQENAAVMNIMDNRILFAAKTSLALIEANNHMSFQISNDQLVDRLQGLQLELFLYSIFSNSLPQVNIEQVDLRLQAMAEIGETALLALFGFADYNRKVDAEAPKSITMWAIKNMHTFDYTDVTQYLSMMAGMAEQVRVGLNPRAIAAAPASALQLLMSADADIATYPEPSTLRRPAIKPAPAVVSPVGSDDDKMDVSSPTDVGGYYGEKFNTTDLEFSHVANEAFDTAQGLIKNKPVFHYSREAWENSTWDVAKPPAYTSGNVDWDVANSGVDPSGGFSSGSTSAAMLF